MKKLFKWLFRLLLVLFLFVLVLILCLNPIAKFLTERQIRQQTGLDVTIGKLSIGLGNSTLAIENFRLYNSSDFGRSIFLAVPEVRVRYDLPALRAKRIHLNLVQLNLGELHIVQNKNGKTNLQALQGRQNPSSSASGASPVQFEGIDTLKLTIGKLKFTSDKNPARNEERYIGYKNETIKNVKSMKDLEPLIARIALEKDVKFLPENFPAPGANAATNAGTEAQKALEGLADPLKKK